MNTILKTTFLIGLAQLSVCYGGDDSCVDYFQRHYKADLVPVSASIKDMPAQGDIAGYQALSVLIRNTGNLPIQGPDSGILAANAISISVKRAGHASHLTPSHVYQTTMRAPLQAGAQEMITVSLPSGTYNNCDKLSIRIDSTRTAKQHGCEVYGNDAGVFTVKKNAIFSCDTVVSVPHKPFPGMRTLMEEVEPLDVE